MGYQYIEKEVISRPALCFRTNAAVITIHRDISLIKIKWVNPADPGEFRQGYQLAADLVKRFNIRKWVNDTRHEGYLDIESQHWISRCIFPQLVQHKLQKLARVVLDEPLAILISCNIIDMFNKNQEVSHTLSCEIFTDLEHALFWLNH